MKPSKAQKDHAKKALPKERGKEFAFRDLVPEANPDDGPLANDIAEIAAREVRDAALLAGVIEFIGMGRFRVK